jgi:hypothetical protein
VGDRPELSSNPSTPGGSELALVAAAYLLVTAAFFAPLAAALPTELLGDGGDGLQFLWNAWWMDRSLLSGRNPYFCDMQFAPHGTPLVLHTLSELPMTAAALLGRGLGMPLGLNLVVLLAYPLAGTSLYALARRLGARKMPALVGGLAFMICPFMSSKALGHFNLLFAGLLPMYVALLFDVRAQRRGATWKLAAAMAVLLGSTVHAAVFAANVTVWLWLRECLRGRRWWTTTREFLVGLGPTLIVVAMYAGLVLAYAIPYGLRPTRYGYDAYCPDLVSFLLPLGELSWWSSSLAAAVPSGEALAHVELSVYLGLLVLPAALLGLWTRRGDANVRFLIVVLVAAVLLAMGAHLQWDREPIRVAGVKLYGPMKLYQHIPLLGIVGQSGRWLILGYLAIAVGLSLLCDHFARHCRSRGVAACGLASLACVADWGFLPRTTPLPVVNIDAGSGAVLDPRLGNSESLYAQTKHGRPLIGGYVARIPEHERQRLASGDGVGWLFQKPAQRASSGPDCAALRRELGQQGVALIVVGAGSAEAHALTACGFWGQAAGSDVLFVLGGR